MLVSSQKTKSVMRSSASDESQHGRHEGEQAGRRAGPGGMPAR